MGRVVRLALDAAPGAPIVAALPGGFEYFEEWGSVHAVEDRVNAVINAVVLASWGVC